MDSKRDLESLADLARIRLSVASLDELRDRGFSMSAIRANLDAGRWQHFHPRVYLLHTGPPAWPTRAWAALVYSGWPLAVLSHGSSAYARGWTKLAPSDIDVTVPYNRRVREQPGVRTHRSRSYLHIVEAETELPRTTAARTVVDLLRACTNETEASALVLEAIRRGLVSSGKLWSELQADRRHPWRATAVKSLDFAAGGLQSILEVRWLEIETDHGLPHGRRQAKVIQGGRVQFQDVSYDDYGLVVELDGRLGHEEIEGRLRDMRRDNRNVIAGRATLRFGYFDLTQNGCDAARQVAAVLKRAGWNGTLGTCLACVNR